MNAGSLKNNLQLKVRMMKKNILVIPIVFVAVLMNLSSCKRDFTLKSPYVTTEGTSYLRIIDAAPNFRNIYNLPDSFNVYINGNKITAYTPGGTALMTFGSLFPTVSSGYGYVAIPPGLQQIKLSVRGVVNTDSVTIANFTKTLFPDIYYTFLITDSITSTRDSSQIFVPDLYVQPTTGFFNLRFIHAVWNDTTGKTIDVWSTRNNKNIFTNVKPGTISSFSQYPYNSLLNDTLYVRRSGSTTITLDTLNAVSFSNQRTYTLYYKGDANSILTSTNTKRRHLATYVHQ